MKRRMPPTPIFDSLVKQYGFDVFLERFCDKDMNLLPGAPEELKRETERLRAVKVVHAE